MFWGFISPGIVASFVFGLLWRRVPPPAAIGAMLLGIPVYGLLLWQLPEVAFLHHMGVTFVVLVRFMTLVTLWRPLIEPAEMPSRPGIDLTTSAGVKWAGAAIVLATLALYVVFR
jgi:SSS family solute:Na+ symporter